MRRIVMWFMSTVTVVVLLFGYHTSTSGAARSTSTVISSSGNPSAGSTTSGSTTSGSTTSGSTTSGSTTSGSTPSGSTSSGPTQPKSSGSSSAGAAKTVKGDSVDTRWGPVQVEVTVAGGTITAVNVPVYPDNNPRDEEINSYALPTLIQETIDQQSAHIDMVSGATVTSDGYLQSLQSALDQAGL